MENSFKDDPNFPKLRSSIEKGDCIAFLGSGLSSKIYPSWPDLIHKLCKSCGIVTENQNHESDPDELMKLADQAMTVNSTAYKECLREVFGNTAVYTNRAYGLLISSPFKCFITTNFDPLLAQEAISRGENSPKIFRYPLVRSADIEKERNPIFYIHGLIEPSQDFHLDDIILGMNGFDLAYDPSNRLLFSFLTQIFSSYSVFFIGCRLREPQLKRVFDTHRKIVKEMEKRYAIELPQRFILLPNILSERYEIGGQVRDFDQEKLESLSYEELGIQVVRYDQKDQNHSGLIECCNELSKMPKLQIHPVTKDGTLS